jgi:hypothetical protein
MTSRAGGQQGHWRSNGRDARKTQRTHCVSRQDYGVAAIELILRTVPLLTCDGELARSQGHRATIELLQ